MDYHTWKTKRMLHAKILYLLCVVVRVGFWQKLRTDFSRTFIFGPPDFFADFVAGFFVLILWGKNLQENPRQNRPNQYNKNPRHISAEGRAWSEVF